MLWVVLIAVLDSGRCNADVPCLESLGLDEMGNKVSDTLKWIICNPAPFTAAVASSDVKEGQCEKKEDYWKWIKKMKDSVVTNSTYDKVIDV